MEIQARRALQCLLPMWTLLVPAGLEASEHERISLDQKVRASDWIVLGTVSDIDTCSPPISRSTQDPATTAVHVAHVAVEAVLKGAADVRELKIGFDTRDYEGDDARVHDVVFSPDGKRIAVAAGDGILKILDASTGKEEVRFPGPERDFVCVRFCPDGTRLISAGSGQAYEGQLAVWDTLTGNELARRATKNRIRSLEFSPDGKSLVTAGEGTFSLWDFADLREKATIKGSYGSAECAVFSRDGQRIAVAGGRRVRICSAESLDELESFEIPRGADYVGGLAFSPDGSRLAAIGGDYMGPAHVSIFDTATGKTTLSFPIKDDCGKSLNCQGRGILFSLDGQRLVTAGLDPGEVAVWDATTGAKLRSITQHRSFILALDLSPDGARVASAGNDRMIRISEFESGKPILETRSYEALERGGRYLLFLRKLEAPYIALVNWQYGVAPIRGGRIDNPLQPSNRVEGRLPHRKNAAAPSSGTVERWRAAVPLDEAVQSVRDAIERAEAQHDLGSLKIDDYWASVMFESTVSGVQAIIRLPVYAECPPLDSGRIKMELLLDTKATTGLQGNGSQPVPLSVDPCATTKDLLFSLAGPPAATAVAVIVSLDGKSQTFCLPEIRAAGGCPEPCEPPPAQCAVCRSSAYSRIVYGLIGPSQDPCEGDKLFDNWYLAGCMVNEQRWHCEACGSEW